MKIIVLGNYTKALIMFRGPLIKRFIELGHNVIACAPDNDQQTVAELNKIGAQFVLIPFDRTGTSVIKDLCFVLRLFKLFRRNKPDLLLSYTIKPVIFGSFAAKLAGVKNIHSIITGLGYVFIGSNIAKRVLRFFVTKLYRISLKNNRTIFFLNKDDMASFYANGIINQYDSITLIHGEGIDVSHYSRNSGDLGPNISVLDGSGVDLTRFNESPIPADGLVFLLIARLLLDKGIREFVNAARIIKHKFPTMQFWLVGPYDTNPSAISSAELEKWIDENVITYHGETKDVRPYIRKSSVYVLPSYREGVPRTVLEAMAMGRPIITTDAPGCRETVVDGYNGFLVPIMNSEAIAAAMEQFILRPELLIIMGRRSREIAEERFNVDKVNNVILQSIGLI